TEKDPGHVIDILQVLQAAVGDVIRPAERQRPDGLGRLAGHAEITTDTINGPGAQADARKAVILIEDARVSFVAALEHAIMRRRHKRYAVGEGARGVG